jgi:hypothetical protein
LVKNRHNLTKPNALEKLRPGAVVFCHRLVHATHKWETQFANFHRQLTGSFSTTLISAEYAGMSAGEILTAEKKQLGMWI